MYIPRAIKIIDRNQVLPRAGRKRKGEVTILNGNRVSVIQDEKSYVMDVVMVTQQYEYI